jgi:hypothetical protein
MGYTPANTMGFADLKPGSTLTGWFLWCNVSPMHASLVERMLHVKYPTCPADLPSYGHLLF